MTQTQDNLDPLREYVYLHAEKQRLKAELESVQQALAAVESSAVERMMDDGFSKIRLDTSNGAWTVYLSEVTRAKLKPDADRDSVTVSLASCGDPDLESLVQPAFNLNTISRVVKDYIENDEKLPAPLADNFTVQTHPEIRVRRN